MNWSQLDRSYNVQMTHRHSRLGDIKADGAGICESAKSQRMDRRSCCEVAYSPKTALHLRYYKDLQPPTESIDIRRLLFNKPESKNWYLDW
jgi:hypothetical protein